VPAALDLDELGQQLPLATVSMPLDRIALCSEAVPGAALAIGRHANVADKLAVHGLRPKCRTLGTVARKNAWKVLMVLRKSTKAAMGLAERRRRPKYSTGHAEAEADTCATESGYVFDPRL
jgi:hypothetical protein